jgi:hypothetical protein
MTRRRARGATIALAIAALPIGALAQRADTPPIAATPPAASDAAPRTLVEFDSNRPGVSVYVAPGALADTEPQYPDPFVKVGRTPVSTNLAPGIYTVTVESPDIAVGATVFRVGTEPVHVRVRGGSDSLRSLGTLLFAGGAASLLAALAVEVSYSKSPSGISKGKIVVPLLIVGGVGAAAGLTFYLTSATTIEHDGPKPDRRATLFNVTTRW